MRVIDLSCHDSPAYGTPTVHVIIPKEKRPHLVDALRAKFKDKMHHANGVSKNVWLDDKLVLKKVFREQDAATELHVQYGGLVSHTKIVPYIAWKFSEDGFWGVQRRVNAGYGNWGVVADYMSPRGVGDMSISNVGTDRRGRTRCIDYVGGWGGDASLQLEGDKAFISGVQYGFWKGK